MFEVESKVYVKDWGKSYSDFHTWASGNKKSIFDWKSEIPYCSDTPHFHERVYTPKLTAKGLPYKNGDTILLNDPRAFENYEYTILEKLQRDSRIICLISSKNGCFVQVNEEGLSSLTPKEQQLVAHLENEKRLQAMANENLGKWSIKDNLKKFPKELIKYLYDRNQNVQFGAGMSKGVVKYPYIHKDYTINSNDLCMGSECLYDGVGCDLTDKDTIVWSEMQARFPENRIGA